MLMCEKFKSDFSKRFHFCLDKQIMDIKRCLGIAITFAKVKVLFRFSF